jgi:hypothetical protein
LDGRQRGGVFVGGALLASVGMAAMFTFVGKTDGRVFLSW